MWSCSSSTSIIEDRAPSTHLNFLTTRETRERHLVRVVIEAYAAQISNAVLLAMDTEAGQVLPAPVKGNLNVLMELSDGGLAGNQQTPQMMGLIPVNTMRNW